MTTPPENFQTQAILSIRGVVFGYNTPVFQLDSFDLHPGERVAFVGRSGCGKTTALASISGFIEPLAGELLITGERRSSEWRADHTSRTIQSFPLFHWLTVRQNIELACRIRGVENCQIDSLLAQFACAHLAERYPKVLSGGERCRASLAQAVVSNPRLLLLDEPFTGLDSLVKEDVAASLYAFASRHSLGVILVTHDLYDAVAFSQRVLVLGGAPVTKVTGEVDASALSALETVRSLLRSSDGC